MGPICHCVLKGFEGFDLGLGLEQIQNRGPTKMEVSTQIKNGGCDLEATAVIAESLGGLAEDSDENV